MMKWLFTVSFLILLCNGFAQTNSSLRFHFLGVKDGLPEGSVNVVKKDKYDYVWMATQNGMVRFDGYATKMYNLMIRDNINVNVKAIFEDRKGRLWAGTFGNGLFGYDRSRDSFISYLPDIKKLMPDDANAIYQITDDAAGNLWFILINFEKRYTTICALNPDTHQLRTYSRRDKGSHYIPADNPLSFGKTGNDILFAGAENGLYQYDAAQDHFTASLSLPNSLHNRRVVLYSKDNKNPDEIWMGSGNPQAETMLYDKLILYNTNTHKLLSFQHDDKDEHSLPGKEIDAVFCAKDGSVWVGTEAGLSLYNRTTQQFITYLPNDIQPSYHYKEVSNISEDAQGNIWCVTRDGFLRFDIHTKLFTRYTNETSSNNNIAASTIRSTFMDSTGTLWFGASQLGLQWTNTSQSKFTQYNGVVSSRQCFPGGQLNEVAQSKDGTLWLSADNGLYRWTPGTDSFSLIRLEKGTPHGYYCSTVMVDNEGIVWTRAFSGTGAEQGLYGYNPATGSIVNYKHSDTDTTTISENNVRALLQDRNGTIWVGTFGGGLCSLNKKTGRFTRYPFIANTGLINREAMEQKTLDDEEVQSLYEDENGTIWAGTNNGSLNRFDKTLQRFVPFEKPVNGMICVLSLANAGNNLLWCGTYTDGLYLVDTKQGVSTHFSEANGLLYNGGWGLQKDDLGNTWVSSPRGISIIQKDKVIRTLTVAGGLPEEPLNFFLFKTKDGAFIYGTKDGFVTFNPADVLQNKLPPPVVHIEKVVFSEEDEKKAHDSTIVTFGKPEIELKYNESRITFHYVGLQYQNVSLTRYQYKLEGYDNDWISAGAQRQITYTNLSPGLYIFYVKAVNSDGVESVATDSIQIIISPPWWKTWWAYLLYFVLLAAAVWSLVVYRSKRLLAQNKLLEQRVDERTQQLNQSITELKATQAQLIQSEKMASLGELTAGIAHEIQNPLNFVNNFSEVNNELIEELQEEVDKENYEEVKLIAKDIAENEEKISYHGKRADAIVKNMLQHSRKNSGQKEPTDINALCDEYLRLSYHGMRTKDKAFNAQLQTNFDDSINKINVVPQDLGRVLLNLFNNAFYAVNEKKKLSIANYQPLVSVQTKSLHDGVEITVSDNGSGIPQTVISKVFQPFFTTKPTGEGTGLGLSLSYDIITKEHGGTIEVKSEEGKGTSFTIRLPL